MLCHEVGEDLCIGLHASFSLCPQHAAAVKAMKSLSKNMDMALDIREVKHAKGFTQ